MTTTELYSAFQGDTPCLISGPCVIENQDLLYQVAEHIKALSEKLGFTYIFKASFDKANRTSLNSFRGPGLDEGLRMLENVRTKFDLPLLTDVHESAQVAAVGEVVDIIQIPAFLCRQTDLLLAAGETGKVVNVKKGQFLTGRDMRHAIPKIESTGNKQILLTERGNSYGNNNLVVDFRNILDMIDLGVPVVMDATHSTQLPGGAGGKSGGNRAYALPLARAAAAVGVKAFFMETHPNPDKALSDGPNMIPLDDMEKTLEGVFEVLKVS
ncbi:MAG: 3-deoxy-8-phosphooctulonate synthase [Bacteroidota bacterium]